jgi:hypothetical protein
LPADSGNHAVRAADVDLAVAVVVDLVADLDVAGVRGADAVVAVGAVGDMADGQLTRHGGAGSVTEAVAIGNVQLDLTSPDRTSQVNSNKITYRSGKTEDRAEFEGDVTLRDKSSQGSTNLTAVGQRGFMTISPAAEKKKNPVRRAELTGSVKVTIVQAKSETARAGNYVATGDKLTVDYTVSPAQAVLSGNVKIDGSSDPDTAEITGVTKLVLSLNEKGELEALEAIGEPVKSTFRRPATKGSGRLGAR